MNMDSATKRNPFQHLNISASKSNSILRDSPPFRSGGRGSKQVAAALERTADSPQIQTAEKKYAFFDGRSSPCFVRIVNEKQFGGVLVQPLRANPLDPNFFIPWDGHLWIAMRSKLHPIEMRVHSQGLEVVGGPPVMYNFLSMGRDNGFRYPMTTQQRTEQNLSNEVDDNWDVISLESGETLSAIPKHPIPSINYHSQSHKPPGEIYIGNIDSSHTINTPMIKVRAFPPLPPSHMDPKISNFARTNASSNDAFSSNNYSSNNNISDDVNLRDRLKTDSSNLLLDKEVAVAAAAAAAVMTSDSTSAISNADESEEFLKIVQIAYSLYKGQKASQQQLQVPIRQPQQSIENSTTCDFSLLKLTVANTITPTDTDKQPQPIYELPTGTINGRSSLTENVCGVPCEIQQLHAESPMGTEMVQTPAQTKVEYDAHVLTLPVIVNRAMNTSSEYAPIAELNLQLEDVVSVKKKRSAVNALVSSTVFCAPEYTRVTKRRLDLSDTSPDNVSSVLISPMLTPNHNSNIENSPSSLEPTKDKVNSLNKPTHKKRSVRQNRDISQELVVWNTSEQTNGDLKGTTLETAALEVGVSLPPRAPRMPKPSPMSKASEDNQNDTVEQVMSANEEGSVPVIPTVVTKRSQKKSEVATLLAEASSLIVSTLSSSRRQVATEKTAQVPTTSNYSAGDSHHDHKNNKNENNKNDYNSNSRSSRLNVGIAIVDAPRSERRARVQAQQSAVKQRDAFLGSWPNRKQSAASGHWKI